MGHDATAVSHGAEILGRVEAKGRSIPERTNLNPVYLGPVRLCTILQHRNAVFRGNR